MRGYTRSKLNIYAIICNGTHLGNASAKNLRSAIIIYCRSNGIQVGHGVAYGQCGIPIGNCAKSIYNGLRPCGSKGRCHSIYYMETTIGMMTAVPTCMGDK